MIDERVAGPLHVVAEEFGVVVGEHVGRVLGGVEQHAKRVSMQKKRVVTIDEGEHAAVGAYSILAVKIFEVVAVHNEVLYRIH